MGRRVVLSNGRMNALKSNIVQYCHEMHQCCENVRSAKILLTDEKIYSNIYLAPMYQNMCKAVKHVLKHFTQKLPSRESLEG